MCTGPVLNTRPVTRGELILSRNSGLLARARPVYNLVAILQRVALLSWASIQCQILSDSPSTGQEYVLLKIIHLCVTFYCAG